MTAPSISNTPGVPIMPRRSNTSNMAITPSAAVTIPITTSLVHSRNMPVAMADDCHVISQEYTSDGTSPAVLSITNMPMAKKRSARYRNTDPLRAADVAIRVAFRFDFKRGFPVSIIRAGTILRLKETVSVAKLIF